MASWCMVSDTHCGRLFHQVKTIELTNFIAERGLAFFIDVDVVAQNTAGSSYGAPCVRQQDP